MMITHFWDVTLCTVKIIYYAEAGCSDTFQGPSGQVILIVL